MLAYVSLWLTSEVSNAPIEVCSSPRCRHSGVDARFRAVLVCFTLRNRRAGAVAIESEPDPKQTSVPRYSRAFISGTNGNSNRYWLITMSPETSPAPVCGAKVCSWNINPSPWSVMLNRSFVAAPPSTASTV